MHYECLFMRINVHGNAYFKDFILKYLKQFPGAEKCVLVDLLKDKLSNALDDNQKQVKVRNLLQALRKDNKVRLVDKRKWYILDK